MTDRVLLAGKVAHIDDGAVIVNRGTKDGVTYGMTFAIGETVAVSDPDSGEHLGNIDPRPRVRVSTAGDRLAVCHPVGRSPIRVSIGQKATVVQDAPPPIPDPGTNINVDVGSYSPLWVFAPVITVVVLALVVVLMIQVLA